MRARVWDIVDERVRAAAPVGEAQRHRVEAGRAAAVRTTSGGVGVQYRQVGEGDLAAVDHAVTLCDGRDSTNRLVDIDTDPRR